MGIRYQGRIDHTEDSIHALFLTQYYTYQFGRVVFTAALGGAMAAAAIFLKLPVWAEALLLLGGCLLLAGRDFPAAARAEDTIAARGGALPCAVCTFSPGHLELEEGGVRKKLRYQDVERLVQDQSYLYLFFSRNAVVMADRRKTAPCTDEELMAFLAQKTGKPWEARLSLLSMNLRDLLRLVRKRQ